MATTTIYGDLIKAQQAFGKVVKDRTAKVATKTGGEYRYTYTDLGSVLEAVMPALHANNLAMVQRTDVHETGDMVLITALCHISGECIEGRYPIRLADPLDPQKMGSAITYARRYALMALLGISADDDDGASASRATTTTNGTRQHEAKAATAQPQMTHAQFGEAVQQAVDGRRGDDLLKLVDEAGTLVARWVTLVKASPTSDALEWIVRQIERRQIADPVLLEAITKQQAELGVAPSTGNGRRDNVLPGMADAVAAGKAAADRYAQ